MAQVEITQSVKASHLANSADEDAAPSFAECSAGGGASIASSPSGTDGGKAHLLRMMNEPVTLCFGGGYAVRPWVLFVYRGYRKI